MQRCLINGLLILGLVLGVWSLPARAIERGYPAYANGAQTFFSGLVPPPPPGFYLNYTSLNYQANKFQGLPGFIDFHLEAVGNALSFTYVSKFKVLGADYAAAVNVPLVYLGERITPNINLNDSKLASLVRLLKNPPQLGDRLTPEQQAKLAIFFQTPQGKLVQAQIQQRVEALKDAFGGKVLKLKDVLAALPSLRKFLSDYQTGLGNTTLTPVALGWHFGTFHVSPSFNVLLPGTYHRDSYASPSQNYFTFMPAIGLTWLPKCGLEANLVLMYDLPTANTSPLVPVKNYYQSGQAIHFDYCLDYAVTPRLRIGASGYYYQQITPDVADSQTIGNHGRVFGIGPAIQVNLTDALSVQLVNQWEMAALNTTEGYRVWLNVKYGF